MFLSEAVVYMIMVTLRFKGLSEEEEPYIQKTDEECTHSTVKD